MPTTILSIKRDDMAREILTVNVGECGCKFGDIVWKNYLKQHKIDFDGKLDKKSATDLDKLNVFFSKSKENIYQARNVMIDLEPSIIDSIKSSNMSNLYSNNSLINGKEDAGNNFARGHYTVGKEIIDTVNQQIRKLIEDCDNCQGFIINHSVKLYLHISIKSSTPPF